MYYFILFLAHISNKNGDPASGSANDAIPSQYYNNHRKDTILLCDKISFFFQSKKLVLYRLQFHQHPLHNNYFH
jgi:hypothetical protein